MYAVGPSSRIRILIQSFRPVRSPVFKLRSVPSIKSRLVGKGARKANVRHVGNPFRHLSFETMHTMFFQLDAIAKGAL